MAPARVVSVRTRLLIAALAIAATGGWAYLDSGSVAAALLRVGIGMLAGLTALFLTQVYGRPG